MSIPLITIDALGVIGFVTAFWYARRRYSITRFQSPVSILYYTSMFGGVLWSMNLFFSNFYLGFASVTPWLFAFMLGLLTSLLLVKAA
jgi:hypothetical protein